MKALECVISSFSKREIRNDPNIESLSFLSTLWRVLVTFLLKRRGKAVEKKEGEKK